MNPIRHEVRLSAMRVAHATLTRMFKRPPTATLLAKSLGRSVDYARRTAKALHLPLSAPVRKAPKVARERILTVEEARVRCAKLFGTYEPLYDQYRQIPA